MPVVVRKQETGSCCILGLLALLAGRRVGVLALAFGIGICGSGMIPDCMVIMEMISFSAEVFRLLGSPFEGAFFWRACG